MADWKDDKDLGSWDFREQKNKWGYLNNPRWRPIPRAYIPGGPDDYSGREQQEPQIWTPDTIRKYPSGAITKHYKCGHWHKPEWIGEGGMALPPLQPCQDVTANIDYIHLTQHPVGTTLHTMGYYYDVAHLNLIPGTFIDVLAKGINDYVNVQLSSILAPGAMTVYPYSHVIAPPPFGDFWTDGASLIGGDEKFFHFYKKDARTGVMGIGWDSYFRGTYYADLGYSAYAVGLYKANGGFTLIPGTLMTGPEWSVYIDPAEFTVPSWPPGLDVYLGAQFNGVDGILIFAYVTFAETPLHAQWVGYFDDDDCWSVLLDTDSEWIAGQYLCGTMPAPTLIFTALPSTITIGDPVTLTWASDGYHVTIDQGIGQVAANGNMIVYPTVTTVYTATATGPGGDTAVQKTVIVNPLTTAAPTTMATTVGPTTLAPTTAPPSLGDAWGYWRLEETSGNRSDATGNGHTGVPTTTGTGVVGFAAAKLGNGATFLRGDGSAYLDISGNPDVESNNHFFFSGWVKVASGGSNTYVLLVDGDVQIYLNKANGNLEIEVYAGDRYASYTGISFDALHFIVVYFNGTGLYVEVDSNLVDSDLGNTNITTFGYLYIGQTSNYTGLVTVDEYGIWIGGEADKTITNRADLWNGGAGYSPY